MTSEAISDHADLSDENATEKDVRVNREVMQGQSSTALSPTPETVSDKEAQRVPTLGDDEETVVPRLPKSKIAFLALTLFSTAFLGTASATGSTILIPTIAADLNVPELNAQWAASAYSLSLGCAMLFAGRLADMYGRKILFLLGLTVFAIFSIVSGVVRSRIPLCVLRALAGLGLAIASPAVYGIAGSSVRHEPARTMVFTFLGLGGPVGASTGTLLGGALADVSAHGWAYFFFAMGGAAIAPFLIGLLVIPRDGRDLHPQLSHIDWIGAALATVAISMFLFTLVQSGITSRGWSTPYIPALLAVSIVLLVVFFLWERYLERKRSLLPVVKPSLFSRSGYKVLALALSSICAVEAVVGWTYTTTIFYQNYKGMSALENAVHVLPANIMGLFAAGSVMVLVPRVKAPYLLALGPFLSGLANLLYAVEPVGTNYWACEFIAGLLLPFGIDFVCSIGSIMISNLVDDDEQSVGGALFQTATQLGGALGVCLSSLVTSQRAQATGSLLTGLRDAGYLNTAVSFAVIIFVVSFLRKVGLAKDLKRDA